MRTSEDFQTPNTHHNQKTEQTIMMALKEIVILAGLIAVVSALDCVSNSDCPFDECCFIHESRYSQPTCEPRREEGNDCTQGPPLIQSQTHIAGKRILLDGVYRHMCPCKQDLYCKSPEGVCSRYHAIA